jgi:tetratricopeptide (TPR) repeat protein
MLLRNTMQKLLVRTLCCVFLSTLAHAAGPQWTEVRSPHFVVLTDAGEKQGRHTAAQLERMRAMFKLLLPHGSGDASLPITVFALRNRAGFTALEPAAYLAKGSTLLDGFFLPTADRNYILLLLDTNQEHAYAVVYHEYTHFVLRKAESLPLWLNEGLAEFYQNTDILEKSVNLGQPSTDDILYLRENRLLPLATLFAVDHNSPYYHDEQKTSVFYSESWALTHMLEMEDFHNKTHRLQDYLRVILTGKDSVAAAKQVFGDLGQLQQHLEGYISHGDYKMLGLNMAFPEDENAYAARAVPAFEANAVRADVLTHDERIPEAKTMLDGVLRESPQNPLVHETLGEVAYMDHDIPEAKKQYAEAVRLGSESYLAYYHFATLTMQDSGGAPNDTVESSLKKSIALQPDFAPAYDALAQMYGMQHKELEQAHLYSLRATELEPNEVRYRLTGAQILAEQQQYDSALSVLANAAKLAKSPMESAMVANRIEMVREYKARSEKPSVASTFDGTVDAVPSPAEEVAKVYPVPAANAPKQTVRGVLRDVKCSYPAVMTFRLESPGKSLALFAPNYYKVEYSTANYQPTGEMDPCKVMEGMKARVEFTDVQDKELAGLVLTVQLSK